LLTAGTGLLRKMRTVLSLRSGAGTVAVPPPRPAGGATRSDTATAPTGTARHHAEVRVVAVGSSTGGPSALATLFGALPRGLPAVYLISQHIDPEFTEGLALWLSEETGHPAAVARAGEIPIPGHVYMACGGRRNLILSPGGRLQYEPAGDAVYCPNINRMFASLAAAAAGPRTVPPAAGRAPICGVVLTGLGDDGAEGLALIKAAGGRVLVQDPATAVVDGMPGAPIRRGIVSHGQALPELARLIAHWIEDGR
jgi:chemotaxis response regulator CheB